MKTALQELISELEYIKDNNCKNFQEVIFLDGIIAIIESKYIEKEKEQIIKSYNDGLSDDIIHGSDFEDGNDYFNETFKL